MLKILVATAVATGLLWLVPSAQAEEQPSSERARALELVRQGSEAYQAGRYVDAVRPLREAQNLLPGEAAVSLNLAMALEGVGDCPSLREAQELYSGLSVGAGMIPTNAQAGLERVTPLIEGRCREQEVPEEPPPEAPHGEGSHPSSEESPGEEPEEGETDGGGAPSTVEVPVEETPSPRRSGGEVAGYVFLATGLALAATGSGFWIGASSATGDRDETCGRQCLTQEALDSWVFFDDRRATFALLGDIFFFGGLGIAAGGLIWALVARRLRLRGVDEAPSAVSLRPVIGPQGGGLVLAF